MSDSKKITENISYPLTHSPDEIAGLSIGEYLIRRLQDYGIKDAFGVPGDYILSFYSMLENSEINTVGCTKEDCAGFAADAYARINGMGVVCVTYCVGGLSLCNSIAGAYAEKSPVVVISGSPGLGERLDSPLLHHLVKDFHTQIEVFEKLCIAGTEINNPKIAFREIDRVLEAASRYRRPVFIELPRDLVDVVPLVPHEQDHSPLESDENSLQEATQEVIERLQSAKHPVILAGVEVHRFGLQDKLLELAENSNIPIATTMLGKSVIRETHPLFVGLYEGAMGKDDVTQYVEQSDCLLMLGTFMTDINLGIYTAKLAPENCIYVTSEELRIKHHYYHNVLLGDFIGELIELNPQVVSPKEMPKSKTKKPFELNPTAPISISRLIERINESLDENTIVVADIGDSLFSASELVIHGRTEFISPAYYTSMGFSIPAALGAQVARPGSRAVVIVGDGAFQMTGMELSNIVKREFPTIVIVLDNQGYGTERFLHPGDHEYNNIHPWAYHKLPEVLCGGKGYHVFTEAEFDAALSEAWQSNSMSLIQVNIDHKDSSKALQRLAQKLSSRI